MNIIIYALRDPLSSLIRYVGQTQNAQVRFQAHCRPKNNPKTHKEKWIAALLERGVRPIFVFIETTDQEHADEREVFWISAYREVFRLTNATDGGDGIRGLVFTEEHKKNLSRAKIGRVILTEERRAKMFEARKAVGFLSIEKREKMRLRFKGVPLSGEHRAKLKIARQVKLYRITEDGRGRISSFQKGRKKSPEQIAKFSAKMQGHAVSLETREKIRASLLGRKMSVESSLKKSLASRGKIPLKAHLANKARYAQGWSPRKGMPL